MNNARKRREEFTLPKYGELMKEVNEMSIGIKIHHTIQVEEGDLVKQEMIERSRESHKEPTWQDITELLNKVYSALEQERYNPVKY